MKIRASNIQNKIKHFISAYIEIHGYPPTFREIGTAVELKSSSSVHKYLHQMILDGELKSGSNLKCQRTLCIPGMRYIDTSSYTDVVEQLSELLAHCRDMAAEPGCANDWKKDIGALEKAISALESEEK